MQNHRLARTLLLGQFFLTSLPSWSEDALRLLSHDFPPYVRQEKGVPQGYVYDLVQRTLLELGETSPIKFVSFRRAELGLLQEKQTAVFPYARTPEREHSVKWVGPVVRMSVYMFQRKGEEIRLEKIDDLRQIHGIGVQRSIRDDYVLTALGLKNVFRMDSQSQTLRALLNRRVAVIPLSSFGLNHFLRDENVSADAIESTGLKLFDNNLYIAFTRDVSDATIARWQSALDKVRADQSGVLVRKYLD